MLIIELALTILAQTKFWCKTIHTVVYHKNRLPTPVLKLLSPYDLFRINQTIISLNPLVFLLSIPKRL